MPPRAAPTTRPYVSPVSRRGGKDTRPTVVLLVRHGRTATTGKVLPGRAAGLHLSPEGRAQAEELAARLATLKRVTAIYTSPLERARETAAPIGTALGLTVKVDRALIEADFGEWTGSTIKDLARQRDWGRVQWYPSRFQFPGGESFTEMATRITAAIRRYCADHPGGVVVAVSHADPIKAAVADALGLHLDLFQRVMVSTCSVTALAYGHMGSAVLAVNHTGDLRSLSDSVSGSDSASGS